MFVVETELAQETPVGTMELYNRDDSLLKCPSRAA